MRRFKGERGASAVEFALILSLLFIVLFGIIQFGIAYNRYQGLNAAAREGARLGSIGNTTVADVQNRVLQAVSIVNQANISTTCTTPPVPPTPAGVEKGCVIVQRETGVNSGSYTTLTNSTDQTCGSNYTNFTVRVIVDYKMRITIPLWASPAITATGTGIFKCE